MHAAGGLKDGVARAREVINVADIARGLVLCQQGFQPCLALGQRTGTQILSAIEEKIEHEIDQILGPAIRECRLQRREVRRARVIECHNLSVDDGIGQVGRSLGNSAELPGPVEAFAREHRRGAILDVELHAVAVELDLVNPVVALRRPGKGLAELRMDEARHGA